MYVYEHKLVPFLIMKARPVTEYQMSIDERCENFPKQQKTKNSSKSRFF